MLWPFAFVRFTCRKKHGFDIEIFWYELKFYLICDFFNAMFMLQEQEENNEKEKKPVQEVKKKRFAKRV